MNNMFGHLEGQILEDGSRLSEWQKIGQSNWQWQHYYTHELALGVC